jgi:hypothetical protein
MAVEPNIVSRAAQSGFGSHVAREPQFGHPWYRGWVFVAKWGEAKAAPFESEFDPYGDAVADIY